MFFLILLGLLFKCFCVEKPKWRGNPSANKPARVTCIENRKAASTGLTVESKWEESSNRLEFTLSICICRRKLGMRLFPTCVYASFPGAHDNTFILKNQSKWTMFICLDFKTPSYIRVAPFVLAKMALCMHCTSFSERRKWSILLQCMMKSFRCFCPLFFCHTCLVITLELP